MITEQLAEKILWEPLKESPDRLIIISSYATPVTLAWFIDNLLKHKSSQIMIELFLGMTAFEGITQDAHNGFLKLIKDSKEEYLKKTIAKLQCSYFYQNALNGVIYIWVKNDIPIKAFHGSAEFTLSTFIDKNYQNLMMPIDPLEAFQFYEGCIDNSIYCNHSELEEQIKIIKSHWFFDHEKNQLIDKSNNAVAKCTLSLLQSGKNYIGATSSLNWGQRDGRNPNQAYIPIHKKARAKDFFPAHEYFFALTDDGYSLLLRVEQATNKAVTTPLSNAQLGEYFRRRLGLANGAFVTTEDLKRYGRTTVTFYKIDEEQYYMDFSPETAEEENEQIELF